MLQKNRGSLTATRADVWFVGFSGGRIRFVLWGTVVTRE
jgi:hypothetical protein